MSKFRKICYSMSMEDVIKTAIEESLAELGIEPVDFTVEHPSDMEHGDYACNVAMVVAKEVGKSPRAVAEQLQTVLEGQIEYVEKIEVAGPGFLNFYFARDFFTAELMRATTLGEKWGHNQTWLGRRVIVEYTDPNPFKEFHIGHLFTNFVGESIARLFMMADADVKRVCYQGDIGLHVAHAIWGMQELDIKAESDFTARDLGRAYAHGATAYKSNEDAKTAITALNKIIYERSDEYVNALYDAGRAISLAYFETVYKLIDTKFDWYFFESEAAPRGKQIVLDNPTIFVQSEGAYIFKGEDYGLHTRVFLNKSGLPTYEAKELSLAKMKEEALGVYDHSVVSTAKEINEYFKVLLKVMSFIYPELAEKHEHIGHGMVRLTTGKMSSRTGDVIAAVDFIADVAKSVREKVLASETVEPDEDLYNDVALAAIKYATLRGSILQDTIFDKDKALSFEGDSGPYLQYTHARICSVLEKAATVGIIPSAKVIPNLPYNVEKILARFEEEVESALNERAPHKVTTYLTELAGEFNTFYAQEKIADANEEFAPYKAFVANAVRLTLKNGLWILGIKSPTHM